MQECKFQQKKTGQRLNCSNSCELAASAAAAETQLLLRGRVVTISEKWDKKWG